MAESHEGLCQLLITKVQDALMYSICSISKTDT